jgi:hypothetical protein
MSQFEQENDLGRGGGEVDDETMEQAWRDSLERSGDDRDADDLDDEERAEQAQIWEHVKTLRRRVASMN